MKKFLIILFLPVQLVFGQSEISLKDCYGWARENYPNLKQAELWQEITALKKDNIKTSYLPQVALNGQATYQSDVPGIDIPIPNISIPEVSKDQYKGYAELKQTIWDGGILAINTQLEDALLKSNLSRLEVELYQLNEQVSQAFFTALVVAKQADVISAQKKVLDEKLKAAESGIKSGAVEKSAALSLKAELMNLEQNRIKLEAAKKASLQMLSILTGKSIENNSSLTFRESRVLTDKDLLRPEMQLFANQVQELETQINLLDKTRNPKIFGFGQAGYGKPGLNMLNDEFDSFYLVGVGVSWNAFDWKNTARQKQILQLRQEMVGKQEQTFTQNIRILLTRQQEEIGKLEKILETDQEMVSMREQITKIAASKLENETITTADYIRELQAETVSKLHFEWHKIQLNEAREKYNLIRGKVISEQ